MELIACDLFRYDLPLVAPILIKGHALTVRSGLLIKMQDDRGNIGWGEIAPLAGMSHETLDQAQQQLRELHKTIVGSTLAEKLLRPANDRSLVSGLDRCAASVRWGVEQALWNVYAARRDVPLHHLLASQPRQQVTINGLLNGTHDDVLEQARRMRDEGYRAVKLKVGRRALKDDVALTQRVREAIGDQIELRLDANRVWNWNSALQFNRAVADLRIAYIEEPLADPALLPHFIQASHVPVALDETLSEVPIEHFDRYNGVAAFVIKPALLGGIGAALQLAGVAHNLGASTVFSSLFESGLTIITLAQLAATLDQDIPTGLDTYRWLENDVLATRLKMRGGMLQLHPVPVTESMLKRLV